MVPEIKLAVTDEEILACKTAVLDLRPMVSEDDYLRQVKLQIAEDRYRLMYIEDQDTKKVTSIIGWRNEFKLFSGRTIYIEELNTLPEARGKGHAGALIDWVKRYAYDNGFKQVVVDSGCQPARYNAHRLYLNKGFAIIGYHFSIDDVKASLKKR